MHPASTNITDKLIHGTCVDIRNDIVRSGNKIIEITKIIKLFFE